MSPLSWGDPDDLFDGVSSREFKKVDYALTMERIERDK